MTIERFSFMTTFDEVIETGSSSFVLDREQMIRESLQEIATNLHFLNALVVVNGSELESDDPYHVLLALVHGEVSKALALFISSSALNSDGDRCPCAEDRREQAHRELAAFDVFANSTAHEEYRPS